MKLNEDLFLFVPNPRFNEIRYRTSGTIKEGFRRIYTPGKLFKPRTQQPDTFQELRKTDVEKILKQQLGDPEKMRKLVVEIAKADPKELGTVSRKELLLLMGELV